MFTSDSARAARDRQIDIAAQREENDDRRRANITKFNNDRQHYLQTQRTATPNKPNTRAYTRSNRGSGQKHLLDMQQVNAAHEFLEYCNQTMTCNNCGRHNFVFGDRNDKESQAGKVIYYICCHHCSVNVAQYMLLSPDILSSDKTFSESTLRWLQLANDLKVGYVFFEKAQQHLGVKAPTKSHVYVVHVHYI